MKERRKRPKAELTEAQKRGRAEPEYRKITPKNLRRLSDMVLRSMDVAGCATFPDNWVPMLKKIDRADAENHHHLVVILWRVLCNKTLAHWRGGKTPAGWLN